MTINSEVRVAGPFLGNDITVDFPFNFKVFGADEVLVVQADAGVEVVLGLDADYTVTLNVDQEAAPGGVVSLLGGPLPSGETLTLTSALAPLQPVDLTNQGGFYPRVINAALDRLTILIQQLSERLGRTLVVPISDGESGGTLPSANERKGTVLAFNEVTGVPQVGPTIAAVGTVAANTAAINTVADNIADVNTVVDNIADVTNFADVYYGPSATDPTTRRDGSPLQQGDLYFNTTIDALRSFNGSAWRGIPNGAITVQNLSGDGIETEFLLDYVPENEAVTSVFVFGVYQQKNTYELGGAGGSTLIFDAPPPAGTDNIEVVVSALQPSDDKLRMELANYVDPAKGAAIVARSGQVVGSIADLRSLDKAAASQHALVTGYYVQGDGGGGAYYLDAADTTSSDNGGTVIVAGDGGRWKLTNPLVVSAKQFGARGDGATDDTTALQRFRDYLASTAASGNKVKGVVPAGRYIYTASPNWAITRLDLEFQGEVWLINNGQGVSFLMDGGATGAGVFGAKVSGFPLIYGGSLTQQGVYIRSVHRSEIDIEVRGAGTTYAGLYMEWGVSNTIRYRLNFNAGGLYNAPYYGVHLTRRDVAEESSYNRFENVECSGAGIGVYLDGALGNVFTSGALQGLSVCAVRDTPNAWNNKFIGVDMEGNGPSDVECYSREAQFIACDLNGGITFGASSRNCSMVGGVTERIVTDALAINPLISGVSYNRFGLGGITDNCPTSRFRDIRNIYTGEVSNGPRTMTELAVGGSPWVYTNNRGQEVDVILVGGTVTSVVLTRFAGLPIGGSQVRLSPGDSVTVTYSQAPAAYAINR